MTTAGQLAVDDGATPLERALADVEAEFLLGLDAEAIGHGLDPRLALARNLPFLAVDRGVTLWEEDWPEDVKRQWLERQEEFKAKVGTEEAVRMALATGGFVLQQVVAAPQGFYAGPDLTTAERNAWLARMPEIRVYMGSENGYGWADEEFAGDGFADDAVAGFNDGPLLYGRKATLYRGGIETPLLVSTITTTTKTREAITIQRIDIHGRSTWGTFADDTFAGDSFVDADEVEASSSVVRLNSNVDYTVDSLGFTTLVPGLQVQDMRYDRASLTLPAGPFIYAGDGFSDEDFAADDDDADLMVYDRLRLLDPDITAAMAEGLSFADVDRVAMDPATAELLVDLRLRETGPSIFCEDGFSDDGFATTEDPSTIDKALRAVVAAKALHDTVLVSFASRRPLTFGDRIGPGTKAGAWVPNTL